MFTSTFFFVCMLLVSCIFPEPLISILFSSGEETLISNVPLSLILMLLGYFINSVFLST